MIHAAEIKRVVLVVLDGLRPDAIARFGLAQLSTLSRIGAQTLAATTVNPSVTAAAMTSLLTGVGPRTHGIMDDRFGIPRNSRHLRPLPGEILRAGFPTSGFMAEVPRMFRGLGSRIGKRLGFEDTRFCGRNAVEIAAAASTAMRIQRRGLILMHWPDADRAGHEYGWMSREYGAACRGMDDALRVVTASSRAMADPTTLLVVLADHGGGGTNAYDHSEHHALNVTIPVFFVGTGISPQCLHDVSLLDVAPTILSTMGVEVPRIYEGRSIGLCQQALPSREMGVA